MKSDGSAANAAVEYSRFNAYGDSSKPFRLSACKCDARECHGSGD